jgi:2-dehydro-3-deoxyphosphogluconate aldolase/(4S)-4-hydroxy-2-oxoglutarate aldolase
MTLEDILRLAPVMPVVTIEDPASAVLMARALVAGGVRAIEVTLRTDRALSALAAITAEVPEAVAGVGTVLEPGQFDLAANAGARFAVSPGATPSLLEAARQSGLPFLPGVATASELMAALERGFSLCKFFPAEAAGGAAMLRSLAGPFPHVRFCPTGGIDPANARDYLALPNVLCVGGSWLTPPDALAAGDFQRIERLARDAVALRAGS